MDSARHSAYHSEMRSRLVIAFGGGKGGVGKSLTCSAVATSMARLGARVVVLDADLGAANMHTLLGVTHPASTLDDFWAGRVARLEDACLQTPVDGLRLISGAAAILRAANPRRRERERLVRAFLELEADALLIDLGAGTGDGTLDFFNLAGEGLVVTGTEPTAIQNAYAFVKAAVYRRLDRCFHDAPAAQTLVARAAAARGPDRIESVDRLILALEALDPVLGDRAASLLARGDVRLVVNQAGPREAQRVVGAIGVVCQRYLSLDLPLVAPLPTDPAVVRAVHRMAPVMFEDPHGPFARAVDALAESLLSQGRAIDIDAVMSAFAGQAEVAEPVATQDASPANLAEALAKAGFTSVVAQLAEPQPKVTAEPEAGEPEPEVAEAEEPAVEEAEAEAEEPEAEPEEPEAEAEEPEAEPEAPAAEEPAAEEPAADSEPEVAAEPEPEAAEAEPEEPPAEESAGEEAEAEEPEPEELEPEEPAAEEPAAEGPELEEPELEEPAAEEPAAEEPAAEEAEVVAEADSEPEVAAEPEAEVFAAVDSEAEVAAEAEPEEPAAGVAEAEPEEPEVEVDAEADAEPEVAAEPEAEAPAWGVIDAREPEAGRDAEPFEAWSASDFASDSAAAAPEGPREGPDAEVHAAAEADEVDADADEDDEADPTVFEPALDFAPAPFAAMSETVRFDGPEDLPVGLLRAEADDEDGVDFSLGLDDEDWPLGGTAEPAAEDPIDDWVGQVMRSTADVYLDPLGFALEAAQAGESAAKALAGDAEPPREGDERLGVVPESDAAVGFDPEVEVPTLSGGRRRAAVTEDVPSGSAQWSGGESVDPAASIDDLAFSPVASAPGVDESEWTGWGDLAQEMAALSAAVPPPSPAASASPVASPQPAPPVASRPVERPTIRLPLMSAGSLALPGLSSTIAAALVRESIAPSAKASDEEWAAAETAYDPWSVASPVTAGANGALALEDAVETTDGWLYVRTVDLGAEAGAVRASVLREGRPVHSEDFPYAHQDRGAHGALSRGADLLGRAHTEVLQRLRGGGLSVGGAGSGVRP